QPAELLLADPVLACNAVDGLLLRHRVQQFPVAQLRGMFQLFPGLGPHGDQEGLPDAEPFHRARVRSSERIQGHRVMPAQPEERLSLLHAMHDVLIAIQGPHLLAQHCHGKASRQERGKEQVPDHSHSMVAGGLLLMSYTTRFTPFTLLMMLFEIRARSSCGRWHQSAVMPSVLLTARRATALS